MLALHTEERRVNEAFRDVAEVGKSTLPFLENEAYAKHPLRRLGPLNSLQMDRF